MALNFLQSMVARGAAALAYCENGIVHLKDEATTTIAWITKEVPGAAPAVALFFQKADAAAAELNTAASNGLSVEIDALGTDIQTALAKFITSSKLGPDEEGVLSALDVSAVALAENIGKNLVTTGLAALIAQMVPVVL